ncbi:MAG: adenylate kinase [Nanoarchaeota archaeon]|nr:adenylate kinase [Nanoarchaeota archaeon]
MRIIIFGPPGAGKGTLSKSLVKEFNIPQISTGDLLRQSIKVLDEIGKEAKPYMDAGQLVPDHLAIKLLKQRLTDSDTKKGFILDGFPRTQKQADELEHITHIDHVLNLKCSKAVIIGRVKNRRICLNCHAIFHLINMPPKQEGICDQCGGQIIQRDDDNPTTIEKRLGNYKEQTETLISYYNKKGILRDIEAEGNIDGIIKVAISILSK